MTTIAGDVADLQGLLRRDFTADAPATKLVGDITYICTWEGWLYLATVLDCFSKKVVGYAMAEHMRAELVSDALRMAARNVPFRRGRTIFHSDRGSQYLSAEFAAVAEDMGGETLRRSHRDVFRQRLGRIVQRNPEERARQPYRVPHTCAREKGCHQLHQAAI